MWAVQQQRLYDNLGHVQSLSLKSLLKARVVRFILLLKKKLLIYTAVKSVNTYYGLWFAGSAAVAKPGQLKK